MRSTYYLKLSKITTFYHKGEYYYYCEGLFYNIPLGDFFQYKRIGANKYA